MRQMWNFLSLIKEEGGNFEKNSDIIVFDNDAIVFCQYIIIRGISIKSIHRIFNDAV